MKLNKKFFKNILILVVGNFMVAFAYAFLILPAEILTGGMGGISLVLKALFKMDTGITMIIASWALFAVGAIFLGKKFAAKTLLSTILFPIFTNILMASNIEIFNRFLEMSLKNPLLAGIIGGVVLGFGIGIIFKIGGSTGGTDIIGFLANKYLKISPEKGVLFADLFIILMGLLLYPPESALIGIIVAYTNSVIIEKTVFSRNENILVYISSTKHSIINDFILNELQRGSTMIPVVGGYSKQNRVQIEVVINKRQYHKLHDFVCENDDSAFMIAINAKDVFGLGFKNYRSDI